MSEQRHVIKRQTIELKVRGRAEGQAIQDEVSRIYRQRIVPLIDQYCSELSEPNRIDRIELLDLDIGVIDVEHLEENLVSKLSAALRRELAAQINTREQSARQAGRSPAAASQLELFSYFARTGSVPWWVKTSQPRLLQVNLERLFETAPSSLQRLVQELAREQRPRQRLVASYPDAQLAELCNLLLPAYGRSLARDAQALIEVLSASASAATGLPLSRLRRAVWENILYTAGHAGLQYATPGAFFEAVLQRGARELGVPSAVWMVEIRRALEAGAASDTDSSRLVRELFGRPIILDRPETSVSAAGELARRLAHLQAAGGSFTEAWAELQKLLLKLPDSSQAPWLTILSAPQGSENVSAAIARRTLQVLQSGPVRSGLPVPEASRLAEMLRTALAAQLRADPEDEQIDLHFSESDALPLENAGLVILWPFLVHFFERLGLLDLDRRFKDPAARQRAAGLLHLLATPDTEPIPEYLLPLNKLLCGMEITDVFDFGPALREAEAQECAGLLEAVIAQAPILRDMSVDGFRGTFLLRPGMLSAVDGLWLLRVERQTYDVVLDRFPWNWEWVKLPWMEAPLRVEW